MEKFVIFLGHLEYFTDILSIVWPFGNLAAIWYIFPRFGGNLATLFLRKRNLSIKKGSRLKCRSYRVTRCFGEKIRPIANFYFAEKWRKFAKVLIVTSFFKMSAIFLPNVAKFAKKC
jgi:hypothetical protein